MNNSTSTIYYFTGRVALCSVNFGIFFQPEGKISAWWVQSWYYSNILLDVKVVCQIGGVEMRTDFPFFLSTAWTVLVVEPLD